MYANPHGRLLPIATCLFLFGSLFFGLAGPAVGESGEAQDRSDQASNHSAADQRSEGSHGKKADSERKGDGETKADDKGEHEDANGRAAGHFATAANGSFVGRHVAFRLDRTLCDVSDVGPLGLPFFATIDLAAPCQAEVEGSKAQIEASGAKLVLHDNPNALIRFEVDRDASISFRLAPGVTGTAVDQGVDLAAGNVTARLFLTGKGSLTFDNGTLVTVAGGKGNFLVGPPKDARAEEKDVDHAIHRGRVAGQIDVLVDNGTVTHEVLPFDDVVMRVTPLNHSGLRVLVDANLTQGRVFSVNLAPAAFKHDRAGVRFFDVDLDGVAAPVKITRADDLADVLSIAPGEGPEYWVIHDAAGTHVLVAVPHFSVHIFEVFAEVIPDIMVGVVGGVLLVAVASVGVFVHRRR